MFPKFQVMICVWIQLIRLQDVSQFDQQKSVQNPLKPANRPAWETKPV